ncbi:MAG: hypothetical protein V4662_23365 [Verrucomicrobiota bacterium]
MPPKRPGTYIMTLLLIVLAVIVAWMFHALSSPELTEAIAKKKSTLPPAAPQPVAPVQDLPETAPPMVQNFSSGGVDAALQEKADELHNEQNPPLRDLEIVAEFLETYAKGTGAAPVGDNADITAAITGTQFPGQKARVFPQGHRAVRNGQLVDRWGAPLWFHPNSGNSMEIRSGGPDKQLFTQDDVILNPSPGGFGATPSTSPGTL